MVLNPVGAVPLASIMIAPLPVTVSVTAVLVPIASPEMVYAVVVASGGLVLLLISTQKQLPLLEHPF